MEVTQVFVRDNDISAALRVLKKKMQREGTFREMKRRRSYEKPSERRVREKAEAVAAITGLPGTREYATGDIFHLSELERPPFDLPKTGLTLEQRQQVQVARPSPVRQTISSEPMVAPRNTCLPKGAAPGSP
jgi:small subunit ribosomal protein S21